MFKYWNFFEFFKTRLVCLLFGCEEYYQFGWNMPDDWHSPTYCDRCQACDDVYGIEETPFKLVYSSDSVYGRLNWWADEHWPWLYEHLPNI